MWSTSDGHPTSTRSAVRSDGRSCWSADPAVVPMLKERRSPAPSPSTGRRSAVHRQTDRARTELRRPSRHRNREHAAAQRTAPAHRRSHRIAGAADRDQRHSERDIKLAGRREAGVRRGRKTRCRICEAQFVDIVVAENDTMRVAATFGDLGRPLGEAVPLDRSMVMGRSISDMRPVQVLDQLNAGDEYPRGREFAASTAPHHPRRPLIREGDGARHDPGPPHRGAAVEDNSSRCSRLLPTRP